ncbi:MAG TPA: GntR family transcriptional regulator [Thermoanaerobaculia bacterium]
MTTLLAERPNLSEELASELRDRIVDGRLPAGERVNEVHLAASLGVSRTPLREALGRLTAEGALTSSPRLGFFVQPLTEEEFRQIYPIRAILDPEALRLAGVPPRERIAALERRNAALASADDAHKVISRDDAWHLELLAGCPNRVLVGLIEQFMRRTRRYEIAYMRERRHVGTATNEHGRILAALRARNLPRACEALRRNMESGVEPILAWLREREERSAHE